MPQSERSHDMPQDWKVMLVEGDDNDAFLMERAFHAAGGKTKVVRIADGEEAMDRLRGNGSTAHAPDMRPDLIVLAIRLPKIDGLEVLKWVRGQSEYDSTAIVICTGSLDENDRTEALKRGANDYRVKPADYLGLVEVARDIGEAWLRKRFPE